MSIEIHWQEMPREVRRIVEPLVKKHLRILPRWCSSLAIRYGEARDDGNVAEVVTEVPYRQAKMTICRRFLEETDENRERTIVHEFLHAPIEPIYDWLDMVLCLYVPEEEQAALRERLGKYVIEGVVQDLTFAWIPPKREH